jgi:hypothetical protein
MFAAFWCFLLLVSPCFAEPVSSSKLVLYDQAQLAMPSRAIPLIREDRDSDDLDDDKRRSLQQPMLPQNLTAQTITRKRVSGVADRIVHNPAALGLQSETSIAG